MRLRFQVCIFQKIKYHDHDIVRYRRVHRTMAGIYTSDITILPDKNFRDIHGLVRILQSRSVNRQETIRKTISQSSMWPQHRRKMQPGSEKLKRWYDRSTNWQEPCRQDLHPRKKVSKINKIQSEKFLKGAWWWKDQRYILQISEHRHLETDFRQS